MAPLTVRRAPYKDFLQPALQSRFASTALVLFIVSYAEALLLSRWDSLLWSWFPLGPTGFRTLAIFASGLSILVLRIAHYHVGLRTTGSGFHTLRANLSKLSTYETAFWYIVSTCIFCPIFIYSISPSASLRWVSYTSGDRARANERTIFLALYLGACALKQSLDHFIGDVDHLDLGIVFRQLDNKESDKAPPSREVRLLIHFPKLVAESTVKSGWVLGFTILAYLATPIRSIAYGWTLMFLRPFYNMPRSNILPPTHPLDFWLCARCIMAGSLLFVLWTAGNTAFSIFMVKTPLKNGQPLSSESKDPNGSLLNGLKSKKPSVQSFAMWELAYIAENFEARRKAIYADIDRSQGPMWTQVYGVCIDVIKSIEVRADAWGKPPAPPPPTPIEEPRERTAAPVKTDNIFSPERPSTTRSRLRDYAQAEVKELLRGDGQPHKSALNELRPIAKKTWEQTKDNVLTKEQRDALTPENVRSHWERAVLWSMQSGFVRALFQQQFRTKFAGAVLGTPFAEPMLYVHASNALCQLAVHSLTEDPFGHVHRDVASIICTLTLVIGQIESMKQRFPVHWTDIQGSATCPEVDEVVDTLRKGLGQVVASFESFSSELGLTRTELRLAKEAAAKPESVAPKQQAPTVTKPVQEAKPRVERRISRAEEVPRKRLASKPEMEQVRA
ncbi:nucleoporin NDC1 [Emericellopsis cladophorae]|uniref:Nucleoporin NDC1 n=1 Tax=Emericellopsis cladophorae TaxID=2686198 RepID=A0A9P9Y1S5_9HYPO|nr:nucleoporin NDC1 [Emericellopsis cladophorae]KAI6781741.1 nucleoporin NDC1 [Emericellopsis cladophorae]